MSGEAAVGFHLSPKASTTETEKFQDDFGVIRDQYSALQGPVVCSPGTSILSSGDQYFGIRDQYFALQGPVFCHPGPVFCHPGTSTLLSRDQYFVIRVQSLVTWSSYDLINLLEIGSFSQYH